MAFEDFTLPVRVQPSISGHVFDADADDALLTSVKHSMTRMYGAAEKALTIARAELQNDLHTPARRRENIPRCHKQVYA